MGETICFNQDDPNDCDLYFLYTVKDPLRPHYFKLIPTTEMDASVKHLDPVNEHLEIDDILSVKLGDAPLFSIDHDFYYSH